MTLKFSRFHCSC